MKILSFTLKIMVLAILPTLLVTSCKDDEKPTTARIHGHIQMDGLADWATWQDSGEVQVTIFPAFNLAPPPQGAGWGEVPNEFYGPGVPGGRFAIGAPYNAQDPVILTYVPGQTEYHYEIEVEPGEYSALAVGFRHDRVTDPSKKTATLGVHWDNPLAVSHGVKINIPAGPGFVTILDYPAPSTITVEAGDNVEIDFRADFSFVNLWYQ